MRGLHIWAHVRWLRMPKDNQNPIFDTMPSARRIQGHVTCTSCSAAMSQEMVGPSPLVKLGNLQLMNRGFIEQSSPDFPIQHHLHYKELHLRVAQKMMFEHPEKGEISDAPCHSASNRTCVHTRAGPPYLWPSSTQPKLLSSRRLPAMPIPVGPAWDTTWG